MDLLAWLDNKLFISVAGMIGGIVITVIAHYLINKSSLLTYSVNHQQVGLSADDMIYGSVKVTWNNHPADRLFLSTILVTNQSMKDFESVEVRVYTNNTNLLTQRTWIPNTSRIIKFTEEYEQSLQLDPGAVPTEAQTALYQRQRDYIVPTLNRGQSCSFSYLNSPFPGENPSIWVDVLHKGITCRYESPKNMIMGVVQRSAVTTGIFAGLVGVLLITRITQNIMLASLLSFSVGCLAILLGAYIIKGWGKVRALITS